MSDVLFSKRGTKRIRQIADQEIKSIVGTPELKYLDGSVTNTDAPITTGAGGIISQIAGGSTAITRAGNQILNRSLLARWVIVNKSTNTAPIYWRVVIGIDWESTGTTPTGAQVFQDATNILSPLNLTTTRERFTILRDKLFHTGQLGVQDYTKTMTQYIKLKHNTAFSGTGSTDLLRGAVWYFIMCSAGAATAGNYSTWFRLRFTDA